MNVGEQVRIVEGASDWMKRRRYWLDDMPDSIDGLNGTIVADYTNLPGDDCHYGIDHRRWSDDWRKSDMADSQNLRN